MNYQTPGAYVEEISKFPPSVAQVETAIPAFIGYTYSGTANEPTRITSLLEYEAIFGKAKTEAFTVDAVTSVATVTLSNYKMYYALQMYFANGGGPCYIVSVGDFSDPVAKLDLKNGLAALEKEDEPTLIVFPDAPVLGAVDAGAVYNDALAQSAKLGDRFVIMDVVGSDIPAFRSALNTTSDLKYGAAYYPDLETVLSYNFDDATVTVTNGGAGVTHLSDLKTHNTAQYNQAKNAILAKRVVLSPSSAVAGVYAKTDSNVGVWKAPANVGLNYVVAPTVKISNDIQNGLNVDAQSGKSINAIRSFTGKGTMVWGARTLDGNSNEWRYVPVRRFFNMVEESTKKATEGFVFESNTANTWVRVKSMIENFLFQQWTAGALAGSKPEEAYYVSVGLNKTMTAQDILEGRMIIEVGMAAVRPAEFIVLRFSHKLQES